MKRRYHAPSRCETGADTFAHPAFADFRDRLDWCLASDWPSLDEAQTPELLADGLHYEVRIFEHGAIATRPDNWHDLLNAMVWCRHTAVKSALNARQYADVLRAGPKQRTSAQYAQTLFDEGGAIVVVRDIGVISAWDRHDWAALFEPALWHDGALSIAVFGHALMEHALTPGKLMTAKCLVWRVDADTAFDPSAATAEAIADGRWLNDPQELRPLPVSGIPGWHATQTAAFYREAECFRPARPGRVYPEPLSAIRPSR